MGNTHADAFAKMNGVELAVICTHNLRALSGEFQFSGGNLKRETASRDLSNVRKCSDWNEMVRDPELEAIDICLPTDLHVSVAIAAMQAGKHVLCEKPLALTAVDCDRMIAEAEEHRRVLMAAQVLRFWPAYKYLERFVRSREYGAILSATFIRRCGLPDWSRWLTDDSRSGGAVLDLLIHDIDQALWLFGPPNRIAAKSLGPIDTIAAALIYAEGPDVRIQGGWFAAGSPLSMTFQVRAQRAEVELTSQGLYLSNQAGERKEVELDGAGPYETELAYFVECCRENRKPERCMPEDSARAVKLALLLKQSRSLGGEQLKCVL